MPIQGVFPVVRQSSKPGVLIQNGTEVDIGSSIDKNGILRQGPNDVAAFAVDVVHVAGGWEVLRVHKPARAFGVSAQGKQRVSDLR